jgi:hypothetical protein
MIPRMHAILRPVNRDQVVVAISQIPARIPVITPESIAECEAVIVHGAED